MKLTKLAQYLFMAFILLFSINGYVPAYSQSNNKNVLIIIPEQKKSYEEIVNSIKREFLNERWSGKIRVLNLRGASNSHHALLKGNRLVIPIGAKSVDYYLAKKIKTPFLASFITESAFSTLSQKHKRQGNQMHHFIGGVSLGQPSYRLASLVKLIKQDIKSVGVVLGPNTIKKWSELQRQIIKIGATLNVADIQSYENPVKKLRKVFHNSQVVIVVPDKADFNRSLARWIVTLSYKYKIPVISYSKKYAEAGALISLFSREKDIGKQTAELALSYLRYSKGSPKLIAPKYFQVHINQSVNKALGLNLPSNEVLVRKLYSVEP